MQRYLFQEMPHCELLKIGCKHVNRGDNKEKSFHDHRFSEIALILSAGNAQHWANGRSAPLHPGDVLLIHPGIFHAFEHTGELELFNLLYFPDQLPIPYLDGGTMRLFRFLLSPQEPDAPPPELPLVHLSPEELEEASNVAKRLECEIKEERLGKHLDSFALFIHFLALIARSGGGVQQRVPRTSVAAAVNYLNLNYRQPLDIDHLARLVYMSNRVFYRRFREQTGMSPREYLHKKRLALAEELLRSSDRSIAQIAEECGFCDSNHLTKLFTANYGKAPRSFRKTASSSISSDSRPPFA